MLSSVLRSKRAIQVNIQIMDAFVRMRQILVSHRSLTKKILELEKKYDKQLKVIFEAFYLLMKKEEKPKRRIGFKTDKDNL